MNYIPTLTRSGDDCIDLFHGFGGWTEAAFLNKLFVKWALNHDQHKADVHSANFPKTIHHVMDVRQTDPRQYPRTRIFLGSPCCDDFSQAKTHKTKLKHEAQMRLFYEDEKERERAIAERQKRATMWDVIEFIDCHRYQIGVIENVVDVHRWGMFNEWVTNLRNLGYNIKMLYLNSMFFHNLNGVTNCPPAPQSRDRWYCVFWRKGTPAPNLDFRPLAPCPSCGDVRAMQVWKNPQRQYGKYGIENGSYYYGCPNCRVIHKGQPRSLPVHPYYYCGLNAIDFSIPIQRVSEFKKPISPNTRTRIEAGLRKYGGDPFLMNGNWWKYESALLEPTFTQTTGHHQFVVVPPMIFDRKSIDEIDFDRRVRSSLDPFYTQTTEMHQSLGIPPFIINHMHGHDPSSSLDELPTQTGTRTLSAAIPASFISALDPNDNPESRVKSVFDPLPTQTGWKNQQAIAAIAATAGAIKTGLVVPPPFIATYNGGHSVLAGMNDPLPTVTTNERHGLTIPENITVDDCYYRTLRSKYEARGEHGETILKSEIGRVMGFPGSFIFFGTTDEVTEGFGGAVTPGKGSWIIKRMCEVLD